MWTRETMWMLMWEKLPPNACVLCERVKLCGCSQYMLLTREDVQILCINVDGLYTFSPTSKPTIIP